MSKFLDEALDFSPEEIMAMSEDDRIAWQHDRAMDHWKKLTERQYQHGELDSEIILPEYNTGQSGDWHVSMKADRPHHGYFNGLMRMGCESPVLYEGTTPWMGITAREVESQMIQVWAAKEAGDVCVGGLGMGFFPYVLYHQSDSWIHKITVYEKDKRVIELFDEITKGIPAWDQVKNCMEIVHQDMLADDWDDTEFYDHCYIDIWQSMSDNDCVDNMVHICKRLHNCDNYSWWTQEMTFVEWFIRKYQKHVEHLGTEHWDEFCGTLPFEMDLPQDMDLDWYVNLCADVTRNAYNA